MNNCQISCISKIEIGGGVIIGANAVVTKIFQRGRATGVPAIVIDRMAI